MKKSVMPTRRAPRSTTEERRVKPNTYLTRCRRRERKRDRKRAW